MRGKTFTSYAEGLKPRMVKNQNRGMFIHAFAYLIQRLCLTIENASLTNCRNDHVYGKNSSFTDETASYRVG